jgi:TolB-like protein/cytochrome c-type biogenesis protein CcmH/NrfG
VASDSVAESQHWIACVTELTGAVFISYASEDAEVAQRICDALKSAGIEVWFDQSELRGGDAWDNQIRKQIQECALFIPIISAHSQARLEGYFRREWRLAAERTHDMAVEKAFLVPVVVDDTPERYASVPQGFRDVQWTRLPAGVIPSSFVERVSRLLSKDRAVSASGAASANHANRVNSDESTRKLPRRRLFALVAVLVVVAAVIAVAYVAGDRFWPSKRGVVGAGVPRASSPAPVAASSDIPDKSIAVLAFVDMSEKHDSEYFSDGLSEELIDRLAQSPDLRVVARTSSFYFKGKQATIADIAKTLGVANVLEGSVRKSGKALRVAAQLIRAADGVQIWSQSYDRNLADIFQVQEDLADRVAQALNATLHGAAPQSDAQGPSKEAYNLVLQGNYFRNRLNSGDEKKARQAYTDATKADPNYALAWAKLAETEDTDTNEGVALAIQDLRRSLSLDPNLAFAHYELGRSLMYFEWNWAEAKSELERAIELDPNNLSARVELAYLTQGIFGKFDTKLRYLRQIVANDPLDSRSLIHLANSLLLADQFDEAVNASQRALQLNDKGPYSHVLYGEALLLAGRSQEALAAMQGEVNEYLKLWGLTLAYWGNGRKAESNAELAETIKRWGDGDPVWIAQLYAYRGDRDAAFDRLQRAYKEKHDAQGLALMPVDPLMRSLRTDPRFAELLAKMKLNEWKKTVFPGS